MIPLRLYAYAAVALVIAGLVWREHVVVKQRNAARELASRWESTALSERANREQEQADRRRADESAKTLEAELARIRNAPKPVSVWCRPATVPSTASEGGAAASPDGGAGGQGAEGALRDVGAALADVWREHQSNAARAKALIEWERERTH